MVEPLLELDEELYEFVDQVLTPIWEDRRHPAKWCARWWLHTEVVNRIQDLCEGWQNIGEEEENITLNEWYRYYLDHHMPIITASEGDPFNECDEQKHYVPAAPRFWTLPALAEVQHA